jgi:hypothetical protein
MLDATRAQVCSFQMREWCFVHVVRRFINVIPASMTLTQDRRRLFQSPQHSVKGRSRSYMRFYLRFWIVNLMPFDALINE